VAFGNGHSYIQTECSNFPKDEKREDVEEEAKRESREIRNYFFFVEDEKN